MGMGALETVAVVLVDRARGRHVLVRADALGPVVVDGNQKTGKNYSHGYEAAHRPRARYPAP